MEGKTEESTVKIEVVNDLTCHFDKSWLAELQTGQSLYDVMLNLAKSTSSFSFEYKYYPELGHEIITICGMHADSANKQYWQILDSAGKPKTTGVDGIKPVPDDTFKFRLINYEGGCP
ncbi:uncharacterized protein [Mytilus edulis]|uniref:uncharacterized protein n=1 Tax=Mytilus edulis TaxID=6550 RepID=UPI0039EF51EE